MAFNEYEKKLNMRQRKFVKHYINNGNGRLSAELAGYKCSTPEAYSVVASRLLTNVNINGAISHRMGLFDENLVTKDSVLIQLVNIITGAETEDILISTKNGPEKVKSSAKIKDRIEALKLISKLNGYIVDNVETKITPDDIKVSISLPKNES